MKTWGHFLRARTLLALAFALVASAPAVALAGDTDGDGHVDDMDNCPFVANPDQEDFDGDHIGDACDTCKYFPSLTQTDTDGDGLGDPCDNCPKLPNENQENIDGDAQGDICDEDMDGDGLKNGLEDVLKTDPKKFDTDGDGIHDGDEVLCDGGIPCGFSGNIPVAADTDEDGTIDALDADSDNDGVGDVFEAGDDNPLTAPWDTDGDGVPDFRDKNVQCAGGKCGGGAPCTSNSGCASDNCVINECEGNDCPQKVCCESQCSGDCEFCNQGGVCKPRPDDHVPFGDGCLNNTPVHCVSGALTKEDECEAIKCSNNQCPPSCTKSDECQSGYYCDALNGHQCRAKAGLNGKCFEDSQCPDGASCIANVCVQTGKTRCSDDRTKVINEDHSTKDCGDLYLCGTVGTAAVCLTSCNNKDDCRGDLVCDLNNECVPQVDTITESGCALTSTSAGRSGLAGLLLVPLFAALRRRRRQKS